MLPSKQITAVKTNVPDGVNTFLFLLYLLPKLSRKLFDNTFFKLRKTINSTYKLHYLESDPLVADRHGAIRCALLHTITTASTAYW